MVVGQFKKWLEPLSNGSFKTALKNQCISPELAAHIDRMPSQLGSLGHDPWGLSRDALAVGLTQFKPIYEKYFRTEAFGLENIPQHGRIMLIGNHSGQLPLDGMLIGYSIMMNKLAPRTARAMIERWVPTMPYIGNWLNSIGAVVGDPSNCRKLLRREEAVIVFPEGIRGSGKTYDKRYQLQRFGTGFMHLAVTENTPIIPVGVVGCEETFPSVANLKPLAKMFGMPYFPVMPLMPFPAKVRLYFGEPVQYSAVKGTEEELEEQVADVQSRINVLIQKGLEERQGWFK
ncbi:MAG TPA: glycerol acyltransferase [Gammaproteobacteria bacterium]|nr:glycerol acyltransferase [Gammaproteobacteria bacterium]HBF10041.1 glycerol acyltransferase [Gammaproteobacteria bacterium]HCK94338.1 glycerol acyltransferase [Gammaproteobacteria bacterium]|tara:strand:+ start:1156 stop:2019 length:864 start_codon:yes stop_codon:yes gene_type:complete